MRTIQISDELLTAAQNFIEVLQSQAEEEDDDSEELEEEDEQTAEELFTAMGLLLLQLSTAILESVEDEA